MEYIQTAYPSGSILQSRISKKDFPRTIRRKKMRRKLPEMTF